eukprot:10627915-Karenia_brevis.AAC.1
MMMMMMMMMMMIVMIVMTADDDDADDDVDDGIIPATVIIHIVTKPHVVHSACSSILRNPSLRFQCDQLISVIMARPLRIV